MNNKKRVLGQFFTKDALWLKQQVKDFINQSGCSIGYDPFAGAGDLLKAISVLDNINDYIGLDIDRKLSWNINDSLIDIPHFDNAIIVTNPPYISNYSAARKKIINKLDKYFKNTIYDDVYLLALDNMLKAQDFVVAIIPETFINSNYKQKERLHSITILEENPFEDTETPVIVACFDNVHKSFDQVSVYKNDKFVNDLQSIENCRLTPNKNVDLVFNDLNGWLGVRCVDTTNPNDMIRFDLKENIDYDWQNGIKVSSRLLTLVSIDVPVKMRKTFIDECNNILNDIRKNSSDVILSPFKGNMKNGVRRRRLDFVTCRSIIEIAYDKTVLTKKTLKKNRSYYEQQVLL